MVNYTKKKKSKLKKRQSNRTPPAVLSDKYGHVFKHLSYVILKNTFYNKLLKFEIEFVLWTKAQSTSNINVSRPQRALRGLLFNVNLTLTLLGRIVSSKNEIKLIKL